MPERLITSLDILVHPDWTKLHYSEGKDFTPEYQQIREKWLARVGEMSKDPNTMLFYFSIFLTRLVNIMMHVFTPGPQILSPN